MFVCRMAQFLVSLLPTQSEKSVTIGTDALSDLSRASPIASNNASAGSDMFDVSGSPVVFRIRLRNVLLHVILQLTTNASSASTAPQSAAIFNAQSVNIVCIVT